MVCHVCQGVLVFEYLFVTKTKPGIGKCAFSVAVPTISNQIPITIKSSETIITFHEKLKTCLFEI